MLKNENKGKDPKRTLKGHKGHKKDIKRTFYNKIERGLWPRTQGGAAASGCRPPSWCSYIVNNSKESGV